MMPNRDWTPDVHGYIALARVAARVLVGALVFIAGLIVGHLL